MQQFPSREKKWLPVSVLHSSALDWCASLQREREAGSSLNNTVSRLHEYIELNICAHSNTACRFLPTHMTLNNVSPMQKKRKKNATSFLRKAESFPPLFKLGSLRHLLGRTRSDSSGITPAPWALLPRVTPGLVQIPPGLFVYLLSLPPFQNNWAEEPLSPASIRPRRGQAITFPDYLYLIHNAS